MLCRASEVSESGCEDARRTECRLGQLHKSSRQKQNAGDLILKKILFENEIPADRIQWLPEKGNYRKRRHIYQIYQCQFTTIEEFDCSTEILSQATESRKTLAASIKYRVPNAIMINRANID